MDNKHDAFHEGIALQANFIFKDCCKRHRKGYGEDRNRTCNLKVPIRDLLLVPATDTIKIFSLFRLSYLPMRIQKDESRLDLNQRPRAY